MSDVIPSSRLVLAVVAWLVLCYAIPREVMQRSVRQHYREWVKVRAYWRRNYDKWIVGNRIFYTDEFWSDIVESLFFGLAPSLVYVACLKRITNIDDYYPFLVASAVSSTAILFILRLNDRCHIADDEIARRHELAPSFSGESEMKEVLSSDQKFVRRVLGRKVAAKPKIGE
jgi:hypothetical protein